jgi:hypothetical protein
MYNENVSIWNNFYLVIFENNSNKNLFFSKEKTDKDILNLYQKEKDDLKVLFLSAKKKISSEVTLINFINEDESIKKSAVDLLEYAKNNKVKVKCIYEKLPMEDGRDISDNLVCRVWKYNSLFTQTNESEIFFH